MTTAVGGAVGGAGRLENEQTRTRDRPFTASPVITCFFNLVSKCEIYLRIQVFRMKEPELYEWKQYFKR